MQLCLPSHLHLSDSIISLTLKLGFKFLVAVQETLHRYKKLMTKMMAHDPETDDLVVIGKSEADACKQRSEARVTLQHVISRLSEKNPTACACYEEAKTTKKQQELERATAALQVLVHLLSRT